MPEKKERDYVNPKRLLRGIMKSLPAEEYVRSTVVVLWTFCNDYIEKDDIANGTVSFSGTVSYSQLAEVLAIGESTAKWRMKMIRDGGSLFIGTVRSTVSSSRSVFRYHLTGGNATQITSAPIPSVPAPPAHMN